MKSNGSKYGLPEKVVFCKKCVMSNQRPQSSPEFKKNSVKIEGSGFQEDGVCDACHWHEAKKEIDWEERARELSDLCQRHRRDDGEYDILIPGSGGKDSIFVAHLLKTKYNMNPLTVTWAPHMYTDVGWRNFNHWLAVGFDNCLVTPNPVVHATLTRLAFRNLVNPFQPFIIGQKLAAVRMAKKFGIKLVMYGENQAESHNSFESNLSPLVDPKHFSVSGNEEDLFIGGSSVQELEEEHGIKGADLGLYKPLLREHIEEAEIEAHFMSYYENWSPQKSYFYAKDISGFESNPDGRSEGTYSKYVSLDDKVDGQHYFTHYIKFGLGRATHDAIRDIQDGYITREEGVSLVRKFDHEFPKKYFQDFLDYIQIDEDEYWQLIDNARPGHLWELGEDGGWVLREVVS